MSSEDKTKKIHTPDDEANSEDDIVIIDEIDIEIHEKKPPNFLQEFYQIKVHLPKDNEKIVLSE